MFPAGLAGAGLLILRLCVAATLLLPLCLSGFSSTLVTLVVGSLAFVLLIGFFTPIVCVLVLLVELGRLPFENTSAVAAALIHLGLIVSLLLLGPGAYSVDAKRFGRLLIIPPR